MRSSTVTPVPLPEGAGDPLGAALRRARTGPALTIALGAVLVTESLLHVRGLDGRGLWLAAGLAALAAGAVCQVIAWHRGAVGLARIEARRHLACDLHDTVLQELLTVTAHARRLAQRAPEAAEPEAILAATARATAEVRGLLRALACPEAPLEAAITAAARAAIGPAPVALDLRVHVPRSVDPVMQEGLVRITREAVGNAVRHGSPASVEVSLEHDSAWRLRVRDDGAGIQAVPDGATHLGLASMRERARTLGGDLVLRSVEGEGTTVEVVLP